jgi:hypothetical protein
MGRAYKLQLYVHTKPDGTKGRQYFITLPTSLVDARDWKKHQELEWKMDGMGNLILRPKTA